MGFWQFLKHLCLEKRQKNAVHSKQRIDPGFSHDSELENGQSRLKSRYGRVLPLAQTETELLSQQPLAQWRTESGPGAAGCISEERHNENRPIKKKRHSKIQSAFLK